MVLTTYHKIPKRKKTGSFLETSKDEKTFPHIYIQTKEAQVFKLQQQCGSTGSLCNYTYLRYCEASERARPTICLPSAANPATACINLSNQNHAVKGVKYVNLHSQPDYNSILKLQQCIWPFFSCCHISTMENHGKTHLALEQKDLIAKAREISI
jgi:hypothetical protein